jgi:L-ascorbate metabolism protein UlaG (beta-lactamase superfamily)
MNARGERSGDPAVASSAATAPPLSITWLGHATVLIELDGVRLITDPAIRNRIGPLVRVAPPIEPDTLGPVDCVLLSHLHADHTDIPSLHRLTRSGPIVVPAGAREWLTTNHGLRDVRELRPGEELGICGLRICATPATHASTRRPFGPAAEPVGYVIRGSSATYFAGDTDVFAAMAGMRDSIDVALLPVWGWGPRLGPGHLNPERAAAAVALIAPAVAIPIHWGTFALPGPVTRRAGRSDRPALQFAALAQRYAPNVEVRVLAPGGRTVRA